MRNNVSNFVFAGIFALLAIGSLVFAIVKFAGC